MALKQDLEQLKTNKVAMVILAVGILAIVGVGVLAYKTYFGTPSTPEEEVISEEEVRAFKDSETPESQTAAVREKPRSFKRQKSISERQITGAWDTRTKDGRALLQLQNGTYRLIIVKDNPQAARWFSNGTYSLKNDLLILQPNLNWGPPDGNNSYRVLTRGKMPVIASLYEGKLVWQIPDSDAGIYVPNHHPLLSETKDNIAVWRVLK